MSDEVFKAYEGTGREAPEPDILAAYLAMFEKAREPGTRNPFGWGICPKCHHACPTARLYCGPCIRELSRLAGAN